MGAYSNGLSLTLHAFIGHAATGGMTYVNSLQVKTVLH